MARKNKTQDEGGVATMEAPAPASVDLPTVELLEPAVESPALEDAAPPEPEPQPEQPAPGVVGWPVQFTEDSGQIIPAVLQRRSIIHPAQWDVKISLVGAATWITRGAVRFSETPKPGYWNFIPGMKPRAQ